MSSDCWKDHAYGSIFILATDFKQIVRAYKEEPLPQGWFKVVKVPVSDFLFLTKRTKIPPYCDVCGGLKAQYWLLPRLIDIGIDNGRIRQINPNIFIG